MVATIQQTTNSVDEETTQTEGGSFYFLILGITSVVVFLVVLLVCYRNRYSIKEGNCALHVHFCLYDTPNCLYGVYDMTDG